jgi:ribosome-binding protein aMBF1 (putative translation factor)
MNTVMPEEMLNDPIALAIAVLVDRIRTLPKEDRNDLFALVEALETAQTEEDRDAVARGMREILRQQKSQLQPMILGGEPSEGLQRWMGFVSDRIRHFREQAGLTQQELADKTGLRQSHISRLEQGHHSPSALTLEKIAGALGIAISELDPSVS